MLNALIDKKASISPRIEMLKELYDNGNDVTLIACINKKKAEYDLNIKYIKTIQVPIISRIHYNLKCSYLLYNEKNFPQKGTILIVDQHNIYCALILKILCIVLRKRKIKVHFDLRTIPVETIGINGFLRKIIVWYPAITLAKYFADSYSFISSEIEKIMKYKNKKSCIWSSGVNLNKFNPKSEKIKQQDGRILFYHGVISSKRGIRETIKAIEIIRDKIEDFKFILVGDGSDLECIKKMVAEYKMNNNVLFEGRVEYETIAKYIAMAEVCICPLPDHLEWKVSSPLKVLEYIAMGKPCILTEINPHEKLFKKNTDGIYWAGKGTSKEIAETILKAFKDEKRKNYYDNLRIIAEKNTWKKKAIILNDYWDKIYQ